MLSTISLLVLTVDYHRLETIVSNYVTERNCVVRRDAGVDVVGLTDHVYRAAAVDSD